MTWVQGTYRDIAEALEVLVGAPLLASARIVDMEAFRFGPLTETTSRTGDPRRVAAYALHVQCPWRIVFEDRIVVGYRDLAFPPTGVDEEGFDPEEARITRRDERMERFLMARLERPRVVVSCTVGVQGSLAIIFDDAAVLELFPDTSRGEEEREYWRLLLPDRGHFVVTNSGVDRYRGPNPLGPQDPAPE
jgi:hypothetical protein